MSSENQIFLFSFMLVCRLSCSKVEAPISSHVPRSLPAQHFVVDKTPVLMTQMFSSRIALHTDTGFNFSYTFLGSNFSFFHYQIRRRKKVIISTPSDDEVTEQGQTPEAWRPPIHARVRKIQSALTSFGRLGPDNPRTLSVSELPNESGIIMLVFSKFESSPVFATELLLASMKTCRVLKIGCVPWVGTTTPTLNPESVNPFRSPWTAAVPKSRVEDQQSQFVTQAQVSSHHIPSESHPIQRICTTNPRRTGHLPTSRHHRLQLMLGGKNKFVLISIFSFRNFLGAPQLVRLSEPVPLRANPSTSRREVGAVKEWWKNIKTKDSTLGILSHELTTDISLHSLVGSDSRWWPPASGFWCVCKYPGSIYRNWVGSTSKARGCLQFHCSPVSFLFVRFL